MALKWMSELPCEIKGGTFQTSVKILYEPSGGSLDLATLSEYSYRES